MPVPDYLICLECEMPCYVFEWNDEGQVTEILCQTCGNDELDEFATQEEFDAMVSGNQRNEAKGH